MKKLVSVITAAVALSFCGRSALRGQDSTDAAIQDAIQTAQVEAQNAQAEAQKVTADAKRQIEKASQELDKALQQQNGQLEHLSKQMAQASSSGVFVGGSGGAPSARATERLQGVVRRVSGGPGKVLVIRSADTDPKSQANLEEDLAVMSRILEKALDEKTSERPRERTAMGIAVFYGPGSGSIRSLYLDGYGALFTLNVGFPLLPPPKDAETQKEKAPVDSTWEEARREVYGQPGERITVTGGPVAEYDEDEVNQLKSALLDALKNASNIRDLKPDDSITVCVFGGASGMPAKASTSAKSSPSPADAAHYKIAEQNFKVFVDRFDGAPTRGSILTIRVKKSDADAFAKDKLNLEEFRKKASIATYAGDAGGWGGNSTSVGFGSGGFGGSYGGASTGGGGGGGGGVRR